MNLYADGWYAHKSDAEAVLAHCAELGATPIGVVESQWNTWGILYWARRELFENHRIDRENAIMAPLRQTR